jgi:hypothetical protein
MGQEVATVFDGVGRAGENQVVWDGRGAPSGLYFCRLRSGQNQQTLKLTVLK